MMIKESMIFNGLIHEKSPYLSQYADNPIKWHKWTDEAFHKAEIENKPVFVFVGYFLCKECYKMKRECFLDVDVAKILNDNFIAINIDKQEEPIVYNIYRQICMAIKKDMELPYILIMSPNRNVFFAETSLPKLKSSNKIGLIEVLTTISKQWFQDSQKFTNLGNEITSAVKTYLATYEKRDVISKNSIDKAICIYKYCFGQWENNTMDKFRQIHPQNILFLLEYYKKEQDDYVLGMLQKIIGTMYRSDLFDHIGLGFFEYYDNKLSLKKSLYNNALMVIVFSKMYGLTKDYKYKDVADKVLEYILYALKQGQGFISQIAGTTNEQEQKYYKFSPLEIVKILGSEEGKRFNQYFNIRKNANGYLQGLPSISENTYKMNAESLSKSIFEVLSYREKRGKLIKDNRIFTMENALLAVAFTKAYKYLKNERYGGIARQIITFIENNLSDSDGNLYIEYLEDEKLGNGTINEYSYLAWSYVELYDVTFCKDYLKKAIFYAKKMVQIFGEPEEAGLYFSRLASDNILFNLKLYKDDIGISGNSIATYVFYKLGEILDDREWRELTKRQLQNIMGNIYEEPLKYSFYLMVLNQFKD